MITPFRKLLFPSLVLLLLFSSISLTVRAGEGDAIFHESLKEGDTLTWDVKEFTIDRDIVEERDIDDDDGIYFAEGSKITIELREDLGEGDWDFEEVYNDWDD